MLFKLFEYRMTTPTPYGWFHIMWLIIIFTITLLLILFAKKVSLKKYRLIMFIFWVITVIFEIIKQLQFSYSNDWKYQWYIFPFQLCSTILYVLPLIFLINPEKGKIRKAIFYSAVSFTGTFLFFGGFSSMFVPLTLFVQSTIINIQTMVHHGTQVIVGIYTFVYFKKELNNKFFLKGIPLLVLLTMVAVTLNETMIHFIPEDQTFNMFFISRHFGSEITPFNYVLNNVPYPIFVLAYIVGFTIIGYIIYNVHYLIKKLTDKKKQA